MASLSAKNILLHYPRELTDKPVISTLIKKYDLTVNISRARIDQDEEGTMVIEILGSSENIQRGLQYLKKLGVTYKPVSKVISWLEDRCTHCGACVVVCPTDALYIPDRTRMEIQFNEKHCIACGLCVPACPYNAMTMSE